MAAVTGAMADGATLYGVIDQAYNVTKASGGTAGAGVQSSSKTSFGASQVGQSLLGVKGSEDMGNGMKASYLYEFGLQTETTASPTNRQSYVGLSGGFGAFRVGKQYSIAFNNSVAADPLGATGAPGAPYLALLVSDNGSESPLRQDKGIQYDLPNFYPGLGITLTKIFAGANSAATNSGSTTETNGVKTGDGQGWAITYTSGPLYAGLTNDTLINKGVTGPANDDSIAEVRGTSPAYAATNVTLIAASAASKKKTSTTTLTYDLTMAKVSYNNVKASIGAGKASVTMYGVSVPLGATTLLYTTSTGKSDSTTDYTIKGTQYGANYALSKRTTAYLHAGNHSVTPVATPTLVSKTQGYSLGLTHAF
jgi:predicted porin